MTTIQQKQTAITFNQSRVCDLLRWQPECLALFMYERGIQYLTIFYNNDEQAISKISARKEFWNWWRSEWDTRDEVFLDQVDGREDALSIKTLNNIYRSLHLASILVCEIAPPRVIYPADFTTIKMAMA